MNAWLSRLLSHGWEKTFFMIITLNTAEAAILNIEDQGQGGFQSLMEKLQSQYDSSSGDITLDEGDLERIPRYAFDYGNGGWENRIAGIFGRTLGAKLGR